ERSVWATVEAQAVVGAPPLAGAPAWPPAGAGRHVGPAVLPLDAAAAPASQGGALARRGAVGGAGAGSRGPSRGGAQRVAGVEHGGGADGRPTPSSASPGTRVGGAWKSGIGLSQAAVASRPANWAPPSG